MMYDRPESEMPKEQHSEGIAYRRTYTSLMSDISAIIEMIDLIMPGLRKSDLTAACLLNIVGDLLKTAREKAL